MTQKVKTKRDAVARIRGNQAELRRYGVKRMGLFGSFAREQQKSGSDIDLLVEFEEGEKTFDNFMRLCFFLEDVLQRPVELVTPESLSPYIGPHILAEVEYVNFES
jgi:uncharacterized protein